MSFAITFNGMTLDGISKWTEDNPLRINADQFPRRQGAILPDVPFLGPRTVRAQGIVSKSTEALLKAYRESLLHKLMLGRGQLFLRDDDRFLNAVCSAVSFGFDSSDSPALTGNFNVEWTAGDPYWYSAMDDMHTESNVTESPHNFTIDNDGQAKTPVRIQIKALSSGITDVKLTLTTTGLFARYAGTIAAGKTLVIDGRRSSPAVINDGANGFASFTGSFYLLEPGTNSLTYEGPTTGADISISFAKRWE